MILQRGLFVSGGRLAVSTKQCITKTVCHPCSAELGWLTAQSGFGYVKEWKTFLWLSTHTQTFQHSSATKKKKTATFWVCVSFLFACCFVVFVASFQGRMF